MREDDEDVGRTLEDLTHIADETQRLVAIVSDPKVLADATERYEKERGEKLEMQERLRFQRAVRDGYDQWDGHLDHPAYVCLRCGVLVPEREIHQRWHDRQDEANRKADSAYWYNQPLG